MNLSKMLKHNQSRRIWRLKQLLNSKQSSMI